MFNDCNAWFGVIEGCASRVFDQAENRLHVQQALLAALLGG